MNKGNSVVSGVDGGVAVESVVYTSSGQHASLSSSTETIASANLPSNHVPTTTTSSISTDCVNSPTTTPTRITFHSSSLPPSSMIVSTLSSITTTSIANSTKTNLDNVDYRLKYLDKESKSKLRSNISRFMDYSAFMNSPQFTETLKNQLLINGTSSSYLNQNACAAQVRTIMKAAGLMPEKVSNRSKLKTYPLSSSTSNAYANPAPSISLNKMTLMAELFASDEDEADDGEELYDDNENGDHTGNCTMEHLNHDEDVEYDDDDEEDDDEDEDEEDDEEEEELNGDAGDEGDDEEENSEVESFTLEDESSLDPKFLLSVDSSIENYQPGLFKNDIELHFSDVPETISSTSTNVDVDQFTDSQLYHELQFASSDVHCVLDEVGATIAKMRISDNNQMPYLVHKLQEEVLQASTRRSNFNSADMDMEHVCRNFKPTATTTAQQCHGSSSHYSLQSVNEEDGTNSDDNQDGAVSVGEEIEESVPLQYPLEELQRKDADKLLLYAAASGHFDMVKLLLSTQKININKRGVKEMTPLMEAASGGFLNIVKILIKHGADVNCITLQKNTALMYACAMGHLDIVKELIAHNARIEDQNENGHTSLMEAASAGHVQVARYLVSQGCNINVHSNEYKETALTLAAYKGHLEMVRFLTEAGAGQEHRAEEMHTALMEASMDGHVEVARLLIDSGAQVNMPPDSFESPLTLAACGGHVELALLLLQRGANIEEVNDEGYTALMEAAREGHEEMVALLISHGAQVNATTEESKETALFMACGAGCADVVNLLIKAGADIELGTNTPLMEAAQEGHFEIVKKLLDSNANFDGCNSSGETALTLAAENGHTNVVKLLISVGADVNKCTDGGRTALMKAAQSGHTETVILLITSKANVNCATFNNDSTALSLSCAGGHSQIVEILLNSGADLCHRLKDNSTMLIEAARGGYTNIVQMLIDYHIDFYKSSGFVQQMYPENHNGLAQSPMNPNQLSQSIQHHHQSALQSKSPISLPPSKLFKHVLSATTTSASPQPLTSNIKLANNTTMKIYPTQPSSKISSENDNFKFVSGKLVCIPQNKPKSTSSSQTNIKQPTSQQSPSQVIKSTRSLSDSFIHKSLSTDSTDSNDLSLPHTASVGTNTSISLANSLPEQFIRQCETLGKENSDISDQIAASIFFTIFRHFMLPETNQPFLSDEQVLNELIDDISEILESNLLDDTNREWLESRFEMIEEFKKHQFCDKKLNQTIPITKSDSENGQNLNDDFDAIVPGLVLQKLLNNKKTRQKFQIDSSELRSLFSMCASNKNNNSELLLVGKEIQSDNLSKNEILVGFAETICQTDSLNDLIDSDNLKKFDSFVDDSVGEPNTDDSVPDHNYPAFVAEHNTKVFKLNPEQIIYGIKNGNIIPIKYLDDALFEVFKKMSLCFISSNKESVFDLLNSIKKLPPKLQTTMLLPLFYVAQSRLQELGFDITMLDQTLTSNLAYQAPKLDGFLDSDATSQSVNDQMSNFFLDETIDNEEQDNELEDDDSNIDMSVFDSFPSGQPYSNSVASLLTSYQNELLASEDQVFELNDNLTVNAATLPPLSSEQLHILKNQFVAAGIFASSAANTTTANDILLNCISMSNANCSISSAAAASSSLPSKAHDSTAACNELQTTTDDGSVNYLPSIRDTFVTELNSSAAAVELMTSVFSSLSAAKDDKFETLKEKINALANPYYRNIIEASFRPENNSADSGNLVEQQPNETGDNLNSSPQHEISFPGDTSCSIGNILSNTASVPQGFVSFPEKFDFNFAPSLFNKDSLQSSSNINEDGSNKNKRNLNAKTKNMELLNRLKSFPDIFKSKKTATTPLSAFPNRTSTAVQQATAATVSINTNTTATATTAVCVGTLIPQTNHQIQATETTSTIAQSQQQSQLHSPNSSSKSPSNSLTATTKSITKLKNAVGHQTKIDQGQVQQQQHSQQPVAQTHPLATPNNAKISMQPSIDVNSQTDSNHESCLTVACANGNEELVKLLLTRGADIELREKKGLTPLMLAATNGHHKIVDILFARGADLEAQTERTKDTALSLACSSGRYEVVEVLLTSGANKEHRNVSDYTPLSLAASGGYVMVIKLLLSYGAEINSRTGSKLGISPLMLAAMNGHTATVRLLLDRGSDINAYIETNRNTALTLACFQGRTEVVSHLLDRNANIEHRAKTGLTPLMEAASGGFVEVGRVLLDMGADVNAPPVPTSRDTALTIAADKGHESFVKLLIERGALVDVKNKKGYSALWLACNGGHFDVIQHLVAANCDCDAQDNRKISCLMAAFRKGHVKVVRFLVRHVTQFPSDQEIDRCLALCTDDELHKKALQCSDILHQAKERQAAEAFKNAANLLEEIDMERSREENRKAAAARRRERRKQKKKEKAVQQKPEDDCTDTNEQPENNTDQDQDTNLENEIKIEDAKQCDTSLKSTKKKKKKSRQSGKKANAAAATANEDDNDEDEDTTAFTIDDEDYESFDDELIEVYEDVPIMKLIADMVTKADLKKKSKKKSKKSKHSSSAETTKLQQQSPILQLKKQQPESQIPPPNTTQQTTTTTNHAEPKVNLTAIASHKKNKTNKVSTITETPIVTTAPDAAKTNKDSDSAALTIEKPFKVSSVKSNSSSASVKSYKNSKKQLEELAASSTKFETKLSDNLTKISDVDSDSLHEELNLNDNASSISTSSTQSASRIFSSNQQTFRSKTSNKGSSNSSSNLAAGHSNFNNTAGGQIKREEGWKEVVRKSKKVQVPANAISRVIGRGGCNINTIREISGAHIEVEKQKGQGNRMVNIRGSADSTRYAQLLITALSKEAEKDLSEIIRELGLENLQPPISSGTGAVSAISTISVSVPIDSMSTMTSSVPFLVESLETSLAQATTIQQQPSSQSTTTFTNSSSRQSFKSVPNRLSGAKSQTSSSGANTMSNSSASTTSSSVVQPAQQSTRTKNNLKNTATSTAASATIASSANTIQQSDNKQPSQTASSTLNTVSYTMAVNSKTRSTNTSSSTSSKTNGVKIMSAIYKPSNKSQIHSNNSSNNFGSNNRNYHQQQLQHVTNSANEGSNSDSTFHSTNDNSANNSNSDTNGFANSKSNIVANTNLPSSEAEYSQFNPSYSNIWSKQSNDKPNFASIAASGSTSIQSAQFSNISQKQSVEIIVDENKAPGFNRHFVSPGSFSTSSSSSFNGPFTTLSINTCTNSGPVQSNVLGPIGSARSAPCTPPISNCSSNFSRVNKQYNNQQQTNDLSSSMSMEPVLSISVSKSQMDSYNSNTSEMYSPSLLSQQQSIVTQANSLQSNMFYNTSSPSIVSDDSPTKYHASNNGALNSPNMFNSAFNRPMGFMEMPSASFYGSDQQISKPSIRSNLNPNAPDFASRSNSLSTNSLPQQPSMNHANSANSLINGSNSSIPSTGFGNVPNVVMPNRPYLTGSAPPISNTAVRAAIVNYSMNLFQNQVPKQHQEAAARLAHLSAQNTRCTNVGNEFQNAFIAGNGSQNNNITNNGLNASNANPNVGNLINGNANSLENIRMIQYMYQTLKQQPPSGTNPNCNSFSGQQQPSPASMSNFNAASQFGALNRTIVSSNTPTTYSGPNFVNSSESLSLTSTTTTSTSNLSYSGSGLLNAANPMTDHMIENGAQRVKPAPIGTERAQRKNPMHGFGPSPQPPNPISNHIVGMGAMNNSASLNPNSILADQALPWGLASNSDPILPNSVDGVAFGASLVGSDYGDFIDRNSMPQLNQMDYNMISQRHQMQPQPRFNSLNMMDGSFGPAFANSNQLTNSFKGINNNANNLSDNSLFPPNFSNIITTNIDSDYWSSSASSSSSITKQTPNCSTSGNNPVYETKPQWNNWN